MSTPPFAFDLKQAVTIKANGLVGVVRGRWDVASGGQNFLVRYTDLAKVAHETWFAADELEPVTWKPVAYNPVA